MCLAIPMKIIRCYPSGLGEVEHAGLNQEVDLSLLDDVKPGDYAIVHAGCAIEKLDQKEAECRLAYFAQLALEYEKA
ncbi:HypC/HybG/HupF family hydrogenase formation chaperone [Magnetococcales bacterium HHB-1]